MLTYVDTFVQHCVCWDITLITWPSDPIVTCGYHVDNLAVWPHSNLCVGHHQDQCNIIYPLLYMAISRCDTVTDHPGNTQHLYTIYTMLDRPRGRLADVLHLIIIMIILRRFSRSSLACNVHHRTSLLYLCIWSVYRTMQNLVSTRL